MSDAENSGSTMPRIPALTPDNRERREEIMSSSGPLTPDGKDRASLNAPTHGRASVKHPALLRIDNDAAFRKILRDHLAHFAPASRVEARIVQQLAHAEWSLYRLQTVEAAFLDRIYRNHDPALMGEAPVESTPTRLGIALGNSVNSSGFAQYLATRLSGLTLDRNRLLQTLRSSRRSTPTPPNREQRERVIASTSPRATTEKSFLKDPPSEPSQTIDSNEEQTA